MTTFLRFSAYPPIALTLIFLVWPVLAGASATLGTIDASYSYAWGENLGWVNFGTSGGAVRVSDTALTGYAWNENYGWINLNPATAGVTNNSEGTLGGHAWSENYGWINFTYNCIMA